MSLSLPENAFRRLLLIDDEPGIRKILGMDLEADGYRVTTAADGTAYEIVSLGRDKLPGNQAGGQTTNFDCDIVYRNGTFTQYPEGIQTE